MMMIIIMIMTMAMIMIMTRTMVSDDHHDPPRAVRGSTVGCSMDMWCPYDIGSPQQPSTFSPQPSALWP